MICIDNEKYANARRYIAESWQKAVKKKEGIEDFPLPYDYIPPCVDGALVNLYYWDTYFTNVGLYLDGLDGYAFNNIENLKFCLRKFGCVPNMCRANGADYASQPPLLALMVDEYYERSKDLDFLRRSFADLKTEYDFWMTERIAPNGLNRYGTNMDYRGKKMLDTSDIYARLGLNVEDWTDEEKYSLRENLCAEGESGEDHTPRFISQAKHVNPIDLNCYLYAFEKKMAKFSQILEAGEEELWEERAKTRKRLIEGHCFDLDTGVFFDYHYRNEMVTGIYCVACYLPYVFGLTKNKRALERINDALVLAHGVTSCEKIISARETYQWGYPNAWAPHQMWAYLANKNAGNHETADKIAQNYLDNVANEFARSGKLFEKYDALEGGTAKVNEYGLPEMLGWTAGVYNYFYAQAKKENEE